MHLDPLSEEFNLLLMQNLTRSHQAQQALDHYEALQKLYQESYGLTPSPELEAARLTASQELYGGGMGPAALETFLLAGDGESRALACDNGTFREIVLLYLRSLRRDPDLKAQLLMLCLEGWEAQPEKNAVYMQQMKLILQGCLRSGDPFTQIGAGQYWVLLPGAGSETHSAIAQRLQQAMHQRFAQSSAVFQTRAIDLRGMVHLAEPKD